MDTNNQECLNPKKITNTFKHFAHKIKNENFLVKYQHICLVL